MMITSEREYWLARQVLPHERALRDQLARWRLPDDLQADDVVQESYSRLAALETVDHIRSPRNYLYTTARTIILEHVRHNQVVSIRSIGNLETFEAPSDEPSPEEVASDRDQLHRLALAVAQLPEPGRRAFLMRANEDISHREIGERLGMSTNAVQKSLAKTLSRLGELLGRGGIEEAHASRGVGHSGESSSNDDARDERRD
jgi:RNA polymerase sigma-70 factor (ECF subfamily)